MIIQKWSYKDRQYHDYDIPDTWNVPLIPLDFNETVNCVNCGDALPFDRCYTSKKYHTAMGMGYSVCPTCHRKEALEELMGMKRRKKQHAKLD